MYDLICIEDTEPLLMFYAHKTTKTWVISDPSEQSHDKVSLCQELSRIDTEIYTYQSRRFHDTKSLANSLKKEK